MGYVRLKRATSRPLIKQVTLKGPPIGRYVHIFFHSASTVLVHG
jgi:hypothetical protein